MLLKQALYQLSCLPRPIPPPHFSGAVIMPIPAFSLRLEILENLTLWVLSVKHVGYIIPWIEGWMGECMHAYVYIRINRWPGG